MTTSGQHPPVVTLASRYGAAGSVIGLRVAERLGVPELLPRLLEEGYLLGLVTGNVEAAAHIKLHRGKLNRFFSFGGYGSDWVIHSLKEGLPKEALQ